MKLEWLANALPAQQIPSQHHFRQFQQLLTIRWIEVLLTSLGPEMCSHNISQVLLVIQTSIYCFGVTPTFRPLSYPHPYPSSFILLHLPHVFFLHVSFGHVPCDLTRAERFSTFQFAFDLQNVLLQCCNQKKLIETCNMRDKWFN